MKRNKNNFKREILVGYQLLKYKDEIDVSERCKDIARLYVEGKSISELGKIYGVTSNAISQELNRFITKCGALTNTRYYAKYKEDKMLRRCF